MLIVKNIVQRNALQPYCTTEVEDKYHTNSFATNNHGHRAANLTKKEQKVRPKIKNTKYSKHLTCPIYIDHNNIYIGR